MSRKSPGKVDPGLIISQKSITDISQDLKVERKAMNTKSIKNITEITAEIKTKIKNMVAKITDQELKSKHQKKEEL